MRRAQELLRSLLSWLIPWIISANSHALILFSFSRWLATFVVAAALKWSRTATLLPAGPRPEQAANLKGPGSGRFKVEPHLHATGALIPSVDDVPRGPSAASIP